jgi:predicted GIY-YIG superfamily endonuclease
MITLEGYEFKGPFLESETNFNEVSAVYVVLDSRNNRVDVGETDNLKKRLANHERRDCWEENCENEIYVAARVEGNQDERLKIEKIIRNSCAMVCGVE